ncbi:MAG TPA: phosphotransferase [Candidatus Paceibacterota bacterium]
MTLEEYLSIEYDLAAPVTIRPFSGGFLTENSVIETASGQRHFLKKQRESVAQKIDFIESAEIFFFENDIPVILPIKNKQGSLHFVFDSQTYTLYPMIEKYVQIERDSLSNEQVKSLAETLAKMHMKAASCQLPDTATVADARWDTEKALGKINALARLISETDPDGNEEFGELCRKSLQLKQDFLYSNRITSSNFNLSRPVLTHGDFHDQNVFFDLEGRITHIFDFEKAEVVPKELEIVRALLLICFNHKYTEKEFKKAELFIKSYAHLNPIPIDELRGALSAHVIKAFHSTWIEGEHYRHGNNRVDVFMQGNFDTLRYMDANFDSFCQKILSFLTDR